MKRTFSVVFTVLILGLAGLIIAPGFIDFSVYKEKAISELETRTGLILRLDGDIDFSLLPAPRFSVTDVSVLAPKGSKRKDIATFERLDVHVALMPLFKGQVSVSSVTLVKPVVALEMFKDGRLNLMTQKIERLMTQSSTGQVTSVPAVSLDKIRIKDGEFSYYDHKTDSDLIVQNINMDMSARSLLGPYQAQGSLFYDGNALTFDLMSDAYDAENKILSPKLMLKIQPGDLILEFGGVVNLADDFSVQGQTKLRIENVAQTLSRYGIKDMKGLDRSLESTGLLSATATNLDYKNFSMTLGDESVNGSVRIDFAPFKYSVSLKSVGNIDLGAISNDASPFKKGAFDLVMMGDAVSMRLKKTILKLDNHSFEVSGSYKTNKETQRPEIGLNVKTAVLSYDEIFSGSSSSPASKQSAQEMISLLALPVDLILDMRADKIIWRQKNIKALAVKAKFSRNALSLSNLSIKDIAGASVNVSGGIQNINNASGITTYVDMNVPDIHKLAQWFDMNSDQFGADLKKANIKAKFSGAIDLMDVTANISAMGGEVIARGKIASVLKKPALSDLILQIKHKNMSEAVRILTGASLQDKRLKKALDIYMKVNQSGQHYTFKDVKGNLSGISVQGHLDVNLAGSVPKLKGDLTFGTINLASIMTKGSQNRTSSSSRKNASGSAARWSKTPIDTRAFNVVNIDLSLRAKKIEYGAWPLIKPSLKINLTNGVLQISDLKAGLFGGNIKFSTTVQTVAKKRQPIHFESVMAIKNANIGRLSAALIGTKLLKVSGNGNLDMSVKSSGSSPAALIRDLNGKGTVTGHDIILDGIDVERFARALSEDSKTGDTLLGLWNGAKRGGSSAFDTLDGDFTIKQGVVHLNKMDLDGVNTAIETRGNINLPNWTLATKHKIIVKGIDGAPSDVPPFEISFNGSLDNPAQTFGQGLLQDYLNRKIQRKLNQFLSKKFGVPSNGNVAPEKDSEDTSQETSEKPKDLDIEDVAEEAIRGLLEGLLR
ncbi:MAG: hypothetical protein COA45_03360 [Zetaproteobacteria bacterium]|nr:MAG: hypothetical protein COA45_03360 [Zetaproteobacteria bacterium]